MSGESSKIFEAESARVFTPEEEEQKRCIYEKMSLRRKRFIDRIGFAQWDPFQLPKDPLDIRREATQRTVQELVRDFSLTVPRQNQGNDYARGVLECAVGIVNKNDRIRGIYDFCLWYERQLDK